MAKNKLAKLLLEDQSVDSPTGESTGISKFSVEKITDLHSDLLTKLHSWDGRKDYNPLYEIAKLADTTDNDDLRFKCHSRLADYLYPQLRSLEINAKQDKEININVNIAGYAQGKPLEIEVEDIEIEDPDPEEKPYNYVDSVLKKTKDEDSL
jgi:hypothetical protein